MTVDYHHAHPTGSVSSFKSMLRAENAAVGFIADIANATKHVERTKTRLGYEDVQALQLAPLAPEGQAGHSPASNYYGRG